MVKNSSTEEAGNMNDHTSAVFDLHFEHQNGKEKKDLLHSEEH